MLFAMLVVMLVVMLAVLPQKISPSAAMLITP